MCRSTKNLAIVVIVSGLCGAASLAACGEDGGFAVWSVDPLVKVFRDAEPLAAAETLAEVARGEHATWQIVVRSPRPIGGLRAEISKLALETNDEVILKNYRYGATGYLHWGYNHWRSESPFTHTTPPHPGPPYLPAGDAWIVYPGRDGPLDSIRHEAMRDGIADYELLSMLGERNPPAAERLVAKHVLNFDRYDCDVKTFRATRRKLLELLSGR